MEDLLTLKAAGRRTPGASLPPAFLLRGADAEEVEGPAAVGSCCGCGWIVATVGVLPAWGGADTIAPAGPNPTNDLDVGSCVVAAALAVPPDKRPWAEGAAGESTVRSTVTIPASGKGRCGGPHIADEGKTEV